MAWTIYRSTDGSAPVLSGQAGALIGVFDACLVNGYGAKAAAGWSIAFTDTNKRAYRQGAAGDGAIQAYLRVLNDGSSAGGNREATVTGYETMSDVDTGTNIFSGGTATPGADDFLRVSTDISATARNWILVGDERTFYFFAFTGDTSGVSHGFGFGDIFSYVSADQYRQIWLQSANSNSATAPRFGHLSLGAGATNNTNGMHMVRNYLGTGGALNVRKTGMPAWALNAGVGPSESSAIEGGGNYFNGDIALPNGPDGGLLLSPVAIHETTSGTTHNRGHLRGLWHCGNKQSSFANGDTFSGTGDLAGKTFEVVFIKCWQTSTTVRDGFCVFETSEPDTN